jgi:cytochrome oxidase Cu insertion factor (SCO1/SenC/PrrC family)
MKKLLFLALLFIKVNTYAQLANGSLAPDFTLTDYYGNTHNLYAYLNAGKTVIVEIFAAHCPSCWAYHQTQKLKNMYNNYGPNGTNELMILALEYDQWNDSNAFIGNGPAWVTQGNWLDGTPYPIFNVEDPNRNVFANYNVTFYPAIYKICPNKIIERLLTSETESQIYQKVQDCQSALSMNDLQLNTNVYINQNLRQLVISEYQKIAQVNILNLQGQTVKTINNIHSNPINLNNLPQGVYLFEIFNENKTIRKKLYLN